MGKLRLFKHDLAVCGHDCACLRAPVSRYCQKFEPLLLVGIAFGMLLTNLPAPDGATAIYNPALWDEFMDESSQFYHSYGHILSNGGFLDILYIGVKSGIYPSLIFLGVGAMTDFGDAFKPQVISFWVLLHSLVFTALCFLQFCSAFRDRRRRLSVL